MSKARTPEPLDLGILLGLAYQGFCDELREHLAQERFDELGTSFGYVFRVLAKEPLSLRELAERLEITPQGALKIVDDMVAKGYVRRGGDATDGRIKRLHLTARGNSALAAARAFHRRFEARLTRKVGAPQATALRGVLEQLASERLDGRREPTLRPF